MRGRERGHNRTRRPKTSLENDTSATAPSRFMRFIRVLHGYGSRSRSTSRADILLFLKSPIRLRMTQRKGRSRNLVIFPDLAHYRVKGLVDVDRLLGGCLHEDASEVFGQVTTLYETSFFDQHIQSGTP